MQLRLALSALSTILLSACTANTETPPPSTVTTTASSPVTAPVTAPATEKPMTAESKVWFEGSFNDGLAQARAEKKLVFVDVFTTWCGPCKKLEKITFPHADVKPELAKMVSMSIDAESAAGLPVAAKYNVRSYPTMLVLDAAGKEIGRIVGFKEPQVFLAELDRVRARATR